ncbi:MAG: c-type cytochrome [Acidimicrobiia bacterium]
MRFVPIVVMLVAVVLTGCSDASEDKYGEDLFATTCAHCHGSDLAGGVGPPLGAGSEAASLTDVQIAGVISVGPGAMPTFGGRLADEQIESLIDYLRERQGS